MVPRLVTRLLFPSHRSSGHRAPAWRRYHWNPAVRAAGLEHRSPYALRHTYASFAIAAGISLFELARFMGTSVSQIGRDLRAPTPRRARSRNELDAFVASDSRGPDSGPQTTQ